MDHLLFSCSNLCMLLSSSIYSPLHMLQGTGMIASSSTFCPHMGRVVRDLFRLLDAVYGIVRKH